MRLLRWIGNSMLGTLCMHLGPRDRTNCRSYCVRVRGHLGSHKGYWNDVWK